MPDTTLPAIPGSPTAGNKNQLAPLSDAEGAVGKKSSNNKSVIPQKSQNGEFLIIKISSRETFLTLLPSK